ncbi:TVP38/TMEM64 family protein [Nocardioides salsibiostraticola]
MSRSTWIKLAAFVTFLVGAVVLQLVVGLPSQEELRSSLDGLGAVAIPAFIVLYIGVSLLPVGPSGLLTIVGGALLGFAVALAAVLLAAVIASSLSFLIGRSLGREAVQGLSSERIRALDEKVGAHGFATVLLARLVPVIPYTTANYAFGVTSVSLWSYVLATALGIIPGTAIYVSVGAFGADPSSPAFLLSIAGLVLLTLIGLWRSRRTQADPAKVPV